MDDLELQLRLSLLLAHARKLLVGVQTITRESDRELQMKCEEVKVRREMRGRV